MGEKTAGVGHFTIPTAPAAGTSCTSGAANTFTTTYVQLIASTAAALYITGIYTENAAVAAGTYIVVQLATGAAASETVVGQHLIAPVTGSTVTRCYKPIYPPIPVANAARIACKTADSVGALATLVTLECINQSNVVDDGVAVGTVTTVTNQLTAAAIATGVWQDATAGDFSTASSIGKSLYTTGAVPGAAGGLQICGACAATTYATLTSTGAFTVNGVSAVSQTGDSFARIGAAGAGLTAVTGVTLAANQHVIVDSGTVTTLTNLPAITAGWLTATGIAASALDNKGNWNVGKSGYSLTQTFPTNFSSLAITAGGAVTAGTVSDKTGYSLVAGYDLAKTAAQAGDAMTLTAAYNAAKTASQAGDAMALTVAERAAVADALLSRNVSGGSSAGRLVKEALAVLRNKVEVAAGTLTVYDTDDTTVLFTAAVTTAAGNPISSIDPV